MHMLAWTHTADRNGDGVVDEQDAKVAFQEVWASIFLKSFASL